ncbi:MAG: putative phage abortive infection protein [Pseudotabrizicola sp.]|uniref:putative phage abortive infection protein n=1 Tax=Pseudotabrizicola sp. TaxID=2939647 RepID=UPI002730F134|nr:putative phage abortive infection protein [Pseudotabrizicola sp.]MDP2080760.1 putative phage abortive infection protein [Pseudotabrizicola sp.]MDZ7574654.1 putative phage abortive infection protein [Pseudotabrizicola sp.]
MLKSCRRGFSSVGSLFSKNLPFLIFICAAALWVIWALFSQFIFGKIFDDERFEVIGQWGDSFGALNALISIFGFTMVVQTLTEQRKASARQAEDTHIQRFDENFFELLRLMRIVREEVTFSYSPGYLKARNLNRNPKLTAAPRTGRKAFVASVLEFNHWAKLSNSPKQTSQTLSIIYLSRIHNRSESTLAPYFRLVYTILGKLRDDTILSDAQKAEYGNILRSQLTSTEIKLIAINGLAPISKDMRDLIVQFRLLKYLPLGKTRKLLCEMYPPEAFLARES